MKKILSIVTIIVLLLMSIGPTVNASEINVDTSENVGVSPFMETCYGTKDVLYQANAKKVMIHPDFSIPRNAVQYILSTSSRRNISVSYGYGPVSISIATQNSGGGWVIKGLAPKTSVLEYTNYSDIYTKTYNDCSQSKVSKLRGETARAIYKAI